MNGLSGFLSNESAFGRLMTRLGIIIACNVLFALTTVPLVTIGAGWAAMHFALMRTLRGDGVINPFVEFWKGFKTNFKQATICWLVILVLAGVLGLEWYWCGQFGGVFLTLRLGLVMIGACVAIVGLYLFPTMAAFQASIPDLIKDSIYFAFKKPLHLIVILFFNLFPMYLTLSDLQMLPLYAFIWCFFGFGAIGLLNSSLMLKQFIPYLPQVDACGDFILDPEDEARWADSPELSAGGAPEKSEAEILEEMKKLGM